MTTAFWCVLVAGLLPIFSVTLAKASVKGYDNKNPRPWLARLEGWQQRANAAQANGWEAFALFSTAVIIANLTHAPQAKVDTLALVFVAARLVYIGLYIANLGVLRSLAWTVGLVCTLTIFVAGG